MLLNRLESKDFKSLRKNGRTFKTSNFLFVYLIKENIECENSLNVGFTITKRVGKAFLRNRTRRLLKEVLRLYTAKESVSFFKQSSTKFKVYLNIIVLKKYSEKLVYSNVNEQIQDFFNNRLYS